MVEQFHPSKYLARLPELTPEEWESVLSEFTEVIRVEVRSVLLAAAFVESGNTRVCKCSAMSPELRD